MINHWMAKNGKVAIIELASTKNRNALSLSMIRKLQSTFDSIIGKHKERIAAAAAAGGGGGGKESGSGVVSSSSSSCHVIVLQHEGHVFSSGHDLRDLQRHIDNRKDEDVKELFTECSKLMVTISKSPLPTISKVDGFATAAGFQLMSSTDLAYCTSESKFCTPGVNLGFFCSTPGVALRRSVPSTKQCMEMLLLGQPVSAQRAYEMGLVNGVLGSKEELDSTVDEVASIIASKSCRVIELGKEVFNDQSQAKSLEDAYEIATDAMCYNASRSNVPECHEGITAFVEKREPKWD